MSFPTKVVVAPPGMVGQDLVANFYANLYAGALSSGVAISPNVLYAVEFIPLKTSTWDRIAIHVFVSESGKSIRLGIYNDLNGYPSSLLLDAGTVAYSSGLRTLTISQQLTGGKRYWLVFLSNTAGIGGQLYYSDATLGHTLGHSTILSSAPFHSISVAQTYGALPSSFPAGGTYSGRIWAIALRLASIP